MLDIIFLVAFALLPLAIWWIARSVVFLTAGLVLGFGLAGNLVQTLISMGVNWNVRGLQVLVLVVMLAMVFLAWVFRTVGVTALRAQLFGVGVPALVIALALIVLRLLAPDDPGALSAIGYFINHPLAEDNAKWLHLSAQIADGRAISFNGYAGGPLLLMMATLSPLISVLSMVMLGGVNQVAVAANSVLAVQFFLIAATPFALAPFVHWRSEGGVPRAVPAPIIWISGGFLALASAVVTSYGHLSQQFTFIVLTLWISAFVTRAPRWVLLVTSLTVATSVSVWVPLNILGLTILVAAVVMTIRLRWWSGLALVGVTVLVTFNAIASSIMYVLGIRIQIQFPSINQSVGVLSGADGGETAALVARDPGELIASAHLFRAPGATEQAGTILAVLAVAVSLATVWFLAKKLDVIGRSAALALAPVGVLLGYTLAMTLADAFITGSSPNYGATKMAFTFVVAVIAAGLPFALLALDPDAAGMSLLRWAGVVSVLALLVFDSLLPRGLSALSPLLWKGADTAAPVYWSAAEIRGGAADQTIDRHPIACVFAPQGAAEPSALPLGQESYACTRLLTGLAGLEGKASILGDWLLTDWQSQSRTWADFRDTIAQVDPAVLDRQVIVIREDGGVAGLTTVGELVDRFPVQ